MSTLSEENHPFVLAQWYLQKGLSFFPLWARTKKPAVSSWDPYKERKPTHEEILQWFKDDSSKNIGVVCGKVSGNLCVLDFDGIGAFENYLGKEWLSKTFCVQTSRGVHVWVRTTFAPPLYHFKNNDGTGVDILGEGSFAVSPPSIHETGKKYTIISDTLDILTIDDFPEKVKELIKTPKKKVKLNHKVQEGERNNTCFKLALRLAKTKHTKEETLAKLSVWNKRCEPPLTNEELIQTMDNAYKYKPVSDQVKKYFEDGAFIPKRLADEITEEFKVVAIDGEDLYYFEESAGVYCKFEGLAKKIVLEKLGELNRRARQEEVVSHLKSACYTPSETLEPPKSLIPLQNGILDLETYTLLPHTPDYFFTSTLPVSLDQNAKCPLIEKFLGEVLDEESKKIYYELAGYLLVREYPIQQAFMFVGKGANGKTTALKLLERFIGQDNISTATLQELAEGKNRFAAAQLERKLANICDDLPSHALSSTGVFKMLTGEGTLNAERKFKDAQKFSNYAKLIFSANQVPATNDESYAFFRRWIILPFNHTFSPDKADIKLKEKITSPTELSGFLNKALEHLQPLLERGQFSHSKAVEDVEDVYIRNSEPIAAFNKDCVVENFGKFISKNKLYRAFLAYCEKEGLATLDKAVFGKKIQQLHSIAIPGQKTIDGRKGVTVWSNICLLNDTNEEKEGESKEEEIDLSTKEKDVESTKEVNNRNLQSFG